MSRPNLRLPAALPLALALLLAACADDDAGPSESQLVIAPTASESGDAQQGLVKEPLADPLRVIVTRDGEPAEDVEVQWEADGGGVMDPAVSQTDADGIAESSWTLGEEEGEQNASATLEEAEGSPVGFTALAVEDTPANGVTVELRNASFEPANVTVAVGQTVTWIWPEGSLPHNVVPDDGVTPPSSGGLTTGPAQYTVTFSVPGVYRYYCTAHGDRDGVGMSGTVTVLEELP